MKLSFDTAKFDKEMENVIQYSIGFFDGIKVGKKKFFENLGQSTVEVLKEYIDSMARVDRQLLHHVYEWGQTGSPEARLFDIEYTTSNLGLSLKSTFRQSTSIKNGSTKPFYDKARIMELGIPVVIKPVNAKVLSFINDEGEQVFTPNDIVVENPGGQTAGGFENAFNTFMNNYFSQSFLRSSGILDKITDLSVYGKNLASGAKTGKSRGREIGYRWIINAGVMR